MKYLYITFTITIFTFGTENHITIHKSNDITVTIPDTDDKVDFHQMLRDIESNTPQPTSPTNTLSPQLPKTWKQRIFQNRTALIAASATVTSGLIAGTVALIVHFTQAG